MHNGSPALADIDGDGDLDVFFYDYYHYGGLVLVENTGTATAPALAAPSTNPFGLSGVPAFADIDADGDLDAFTPSRDGIVFFANTGSASVPAFAAPATNPFGLAGVGEEPEFADVDDDGDLDAFFGTFSGDTIFLRNTGNASAPAFATPSTNPFGLVDIGWEAAPDLADIDGDGDLDALVGGDLAGNVGGFAFFENTGSAALPAFGAPVSVPFGLLWGASSNEVRASPALGDLDGDGDLDLLVGSYYTPLVEFENTGTANAPAFTSAGNPFGLTGGYRSSPALADIDADRDLDAFVGEVDGTTYFLENTGTAMAPAFAVPSINSLGLAHVGSRSAPAFADLDGDGDLDALIGEGSGNTIFFRNTGTASAPAFAAPSTNPFGLADVGPSLIASASPAFADLDGDGDLDGFVGERYGRIIFFRNTGTASAPAFAAPSTNPFGLADVGIYASPDFADLDGDGDLDAFVGESGGNTIFFRNTGTAIVPAFAAPSAHPFGLADVGRLASPEVADIDGDGDLDAFVGEEFRASVFLFENVLIDPEACTDGIDNDSDGLIDLGNDPGCANAADTSELSSLQCDNGLDDDGDGRIDWRADGSGDPQCMGPRADREAPPPPNSGCGLGPELLLVAPLLAAVRRRSQPRD